MESTNRIWIGLGVGCIAMLVLLAASGLGAAGHSDPGDVHETAEQHAACAGVIPGPSDYLAIYRLCGASAFISVEHVAGDCQNSGCYITVTCLGTASGLVTVTGQLLCGDVDVSGNVDPTIGGTPDSCVSPGIALEETSCSLSRFGQAYVFNGSCRDLAAETAATSPFGPAVARAGPIKVCSVNGNVWVSG